MNTIFLILSFLISLSALCQQDSSCALLENAIRNSGESQAIWYADSSLPFNVKVSGLVQKGKIYGYADTSRVYLSIKKHEAWKLDEEIRKTRPRTWGPGLFRNSRMMTADSAYYLSRKLNQEQPGQKQKPYFFFSRIVYFRNNSWAVFEFGAMYNHSAGYHYLFFCQKTATGWAPYMMVRLGAW